MVTSKPDVSKSTERLSADAAETVKSLQRDTLKALSGLGGGDATRTNQNATPREPTTADLARTFGQLAYAGNDLPAVTMRASNRDENNAEGKRSEGVNPTNHSLKPGASSASPTPSTENGAGHIRTAKHPRKKGDAVRMAVDKEEMDDPRGHGLRSLPAESEGKPKNEGKNSVVSGTKVESPRMIGYYEKDSKQLPIHPFTDTVPSTLRWDPETNTVHESFAKPFVIQDPEQDVGKGGVIVDTKTSRQIMRREESIQDGKPRKDIEIAKMVGYRGIGTALGVTGDRELVSVKMWQTVDKDGTTKSYRQAVIKDYNFIAQLVEKQRPVETMTNAEFERRWKELDPKVLQRYTS